MGLGTFMGGLEGVSGGIQGGDCGYCVMGVLRFLLPLRLSLLFLSPLLLLLPGSIIVSAMCKIKETRARTISEVDD